MEAELRLRLFNRRAELKFTFNQGNSQQKVSSHLDTLKYEYKGGRTNIVDGIQVCADHFNSQARRNAKRVLIVLTDGEDNEHMWSFTSVYTLMSEAASTSGANYRIAVGVGNRADKTALNAIIKTATQGSTFNVNSFGDLKNYVTDIKRRTCPCPPGYENIDGVCTKICPEGNKPNGNKCIKICPVGYKPNGDKCEKICPEGYHAEGDECIKTCPKGYKPNGNQCEKICPKGHKAHGDQCIKICPQGYKPNGDKCEKICPKGYHAEGDKCIKTCPKGYKPNGDKCEKICPKGYHAEGDKCIKTCPQGYKPEGGECIKICPQGYKPEGDKCIKICPEGPVAQGDECIPIRCPDNTEKIEGKCVPKCDGGLYHEGYTTSPDVPTFDFDARPEGQQGDYQLKDVKNGYLKMFYNENGNKYLAQACNEERSQTHYYSDFAEENSQCVQEYFYGTGGEYGRLMGRQSRNGACRGWGLETRLNGRYVRMVHNCQLKNTANQNDIIHRKLCVAFKMNCRTALRDPIVCCNFPSDIIAIEHVGPITVSILNKSPK